MSEICYSSVWDYSGVRNLLFRCLRFVIQVSEIFYSGVLNLLFWCVKFDILMSDVCYSGV